MLEKERPLRTALRILAIALAAYYVLALLIITPALNFLPAWYVEKTWGRNLETRWVILNPFKLSLDLASARLSEPDGERFLDIGESSVNLSLTSLWRPGIVLDELKVHDLYVNIVRNSETSFNFSDLLPADDGSEPEEDEGPPLALTIQQVDISSEAIVVNDLTRETPYQSAWTGLSLNVQELSTVLEEGKPYALEVTGPEGGTLRWEGTLSLPGAYSEGAFQISGVRMHNLWQAAEPWLSFEVTKGRMDLAANYRVGWQGPLSYHLGEGSFGLSEVAIAPRASSDLADTAISLKELAIDGIDVSSDTLSAKIDSVMIDGLVASGFSEGTRISLEEMLLGAADPNEPAAAPPPAPEDDSDAAQWSAQLQQFEVRNSGINWRSEYTEPALLRVTPIAAEASNLQWPLAGKAPFALDLSINDTARVDVEGEITLDSGDADISYSLSALPLPWFNPNLPSALNAAITSGQVDLEGAVSLHDFFPAKITLDAAITEFSAHQKDVETTFTSWSAVRATGLEVDLDTQAFALQELAINDYSGRLHIYQDGSINALNIWQAELSSAEATPAPASEQGGAQEASGPDATADATDEAGAEESAPWSVNLAQVLISDSQVDFMDESLPITFRAVVGELNGHIKGISSEPGASAEVDMQGSVNDTAPEPLRRAHGARSRPRLQGGGYGVAQPLFRHLCRLPDQKRPARPGARLQARQ